MELPEGYEAIVAARSSSFEKWGFIPVNGIGIIDNNYNGNNDVWNLLVYATRDAIIEKDERIAQFRILKNQPVISFSEVEDLGHEDRGGIGSTGVE
jgi:dUTP pyrophosphatase